MKKTRLVFVILLATNVVNIQTIYSKAYANPNDKPLIFLHGGLSNHPIGENNLVYLNNYSNNLCIDQQTEFINAIKTGPSNEF